MCTVVAWCMTKDDLDSDRTEVSGLPGKVDERFDGAS